eukprot:11042549-Alexandrium_andersonii.AAC.1
MYEKSGLELWRQLTAEYEPNAGDRAPAWDQEILEGCALTGATVDTFEEKLRDWERLVEEHEESIGAVLESDIKRAVLIKRAPTEGREQLAFTATELETYDTYDKMRLAIIRYCKMRQDWDQFLNASTEQHEKNHAPMIMDAVDDNQGRLLTRRRLRWGKHKDSKIKGKDKQSHKGLDTKNETVGHINGHDKSWVFGVFSSSHEQANTENSDSIEIMVDSGSWVNTCGWDQWNDVQSANLEPKELYGIDGKQLSWMGSCSPKLELPSGQSCSVEFDITNTSKPIMSVGKGCLLYTSDAADDM